MKPKKTSETVILTAEDITAEMIIEAAPKVARMYEIADKQNKAALTFSDINKYSLYPKRPGMTNDKFIEVIIKIFRLMCLIGYM